MTRAVRTPPSTLTAWAPASCRKIPAFSSASSGRRVGEERHVADDQRARRAADDGLGVVDHLGHRHAHRRLVAEDDLAERIADEDQRDPGLVEDLGGRIVVRGQHRQALAVGVHLRDVDDGQAARGLGRGAHAGSRSGSVVRPVWADASRSSSAAATRSSSASATARLDWRGRSSRDPSAARIETRLVSVPKPGAGLGDVVGDEEVDALAAELLAGALERARLGGEPDEDRARVRAARGSARRRCRGRGRSGRPRRAGRGSPRAGGSASPREAAWSRPAAAGRKSATAAAMTRASNPAPPSGPCVARRSAARRSAVDSTRTTVGGGRQGDLGVGRDDRHARAAVERGLGDRRRPSARSSGCR